MERAFRDICIIALTETWLDDSVSDDEVSLDNFTIIRSDRTRNSGKTRGGGLCLYINDRWCSNIKTHRRVCSPDLEMLTVSLRPYYLPREFPTVVVSCVYIEPSANGNIAAELVAEDANAMAAKYPGSPVLILGDFNTCRLDSVLPTFQQNVDTPTRGNNILDLCYGNNSEAFRTNSYPPLGLADHNVICLLPLYKQVLKRLHPQSYSAPQWSEDSTAQLQGSLACTDWTIFDGDLNSKVTAISDYINFCIHTTIPVKAIKKYPNSKPWITSEIKKCLKAKHTAFRLKDSAGLKSANRNIKNKILMAKIQFKNNLEHKFSSMNTKEAFQMVNTLTGYKPTHSKTKLHTTALPTELNTFFNRFDSQDFTNDCMQALQALPPIDPNEPAPFTVEEVRHQLSRCNPSKAPGPDGIPARVLKTCATELAPIAHSLFCQSYLTATTPPLEKCNHNPGTQKTTTHRTKSLPPHRPHTHNHEMFRKTAAQDHPSIRQTSSGSPSICIQGKKGHRGRCRLPAASCPPAPGLLRQFRQNSIRGLQLRLQHHPETPAHPEASPPQHSTHPDPSPAQLPQ
jgi:hypothetical protein